MSKEHYCIGTWNVRSMNQGKLEGVKQEVARVNVDILGISELKWTGMGEFNSVQFSSVAQSCLTLCDPMDFSLPSFSVHGIFQAIVLEWIAISFSILILSEVISPLISSNILGTY